MPKELIIKFVLEVYQHNKQTKEYIEYLLNPNEKEMLEKFREIVMNEFYPKKNKHDPKLRFSVCKKAISEFRSLKPAPALLAELLITFPETACKFAHECGDMCEQYYDSAVANYEIALKYIQKNDLLQPYKQRCKKCIKYASKGGYGFKDQIESIFDEYYSDQK